MYVCFVQRTHNKVYIIRTCNVCTKKTAFRKCIIETASIHTYQLFQETDETKPKEIRHILRTPLSSESRTKRTFFQQDDATTRRTKPSLATLRKILRERIITCILPLWPVLSRDMTPCNSYLWEIVSDNSHKSIPHSKEKLKKSLDMQQRELLGKNFKHL